MRAMAVAHNFSCPALSFTLAPFTQRPRPSTTRTSRRSQRPRPSTTRIFSDEVDDVECESSDDDEASVVNLSDDNYVDGAGALEVIDDDAPKLSEGLLEAIFINWTRTGHLDARGVGGERRATPTPYYGRVRQRAVPRRARGAGGADLLPGRASVRESSFVGSGGKVTVPVRGGAWAIQPPKPPQKPALLRFWLEFPEEAKRNDVTLPPGVFLHCAGVAGD